METDGGMAGEPGFTWRPPGGVLADYQEYWEPTTDAPDVYGSIRVSQRYFGAFRCFSWVI